MNLNEEFLKNMFNSSKIPVIDFGLGDISRKAQELTDKLSISGIQPKLSVTLDEKQNMLIPVAEGGEYILKPQTSTFPNIPENEQCCMDIAKELNIEVPLHCLIPLKDKSLAYVVKRFDREKSVKIHQEDFGQILEQTDKYKGSVEQIGRKLKEISSAPGYDVQLLFERVVLNFILGNGDAHLKNYSIAYRDKDNIRLTPAYDIVCSKLVIPGDEDSAITIHGKKNKLLREDFDQLGDDFSIPIKIRYEKFGNKFNVMRKIIETSSIAKEKQGQFLEIIKERINRIGLLE
ncbi:MAG: HipA domain-containing protein [Candidatus Omnitrophica bacterium]|nr:HipA domain-containing protein [Candidatus Omnitrophota bacterium]